MKIAILSESAYPVLNGVSVSTDVLASGLTKRGHKVLLICPENSNKNDSNNNYEIVRTPSYNIVSGYPLPYPNKNLIFSILENFKPDIVHCQIPFTYGLIAKEWTKLTNTTFSAFNHTKYVNYGHYAGILKDIIKVPLKSYLANFYNSADIVMTPSIMMKDELKSYGVTKEISVIPTGIPLPEAEDKNVTEEIRRKYNISPTDKVVIYLSRIAKEKNIHLLIDSFNELYSKYNNLKLMVCGGGPDFKELVAYRDTLQSRENIIFTGGVEKKQVYNYLYCGDIFAFPSTTETQGLAVCEAMACGLCVVAVNEGGTVESIENNVDGLLCGNNVNSFKSAISEILDNEKLREKLSFNALKSAENFSIKAMLDKYEDVFVGGGYYT